MDSFRELYETPEITEEIIRFRGIDWLCPSDGSLSNKAPGFKEDMANFIPHFVEIGGKKFVNFVNKEKQHVGFYSHAFKHLDLLLETGGKEWVCHTGGRGNKHMGFDSDKQRLDIALKLAVVGGPEYVNYKIGVSTFYGMHDRTVNYTVAMAEIGGKEFIIEHGLGFDKRFKNFIPKFAKICGPDFINETDEEGCHIGFYCDIKHIPYLYKIGGEEWANHKNKDGKTMKTRRR